MLSSSSSVSGRRSVARRVTAIGIAMVALVLLALSLVTASITNQASRTQLVASVGHATQARVASIDTVEQANRDMVLKASEGFARHFAGKLVDGLVACRPFLPLRFNQIMFPVELHCAIDLLSVYAESLGGLQMREA